MQQARPYVKNAADRKQVHKAKKKEELNRHDSIEDLKQVLSTIQGRRFVWGLLEDTGVFRSSFTGSSETFFLEGQRNVGLKLLADINAASEEAFSIMLKESKGERYV